MKLPSNLGRGSVALNMTPMIDVVFLLIIFFLLSSHLAKQEVQQDLDLPSAQSGNRPPEEDKRRAVVNVMGDGQIHFAGRHVSADELQRLLALHRKAHGDDLEVRIRSDQQVPYQHFKPVMVACARAGTWNIKIAVVKKKGGAGL